MQQPGTSLHDSVLFVCNCPSAHVACFRSALTVCALQTDRITLCVHVKHLGLCSEFSWPFFFFFERSVRLFRWTAIWGWNRIGLGLPKEGMDYKKRKNADCWLQDKWHHWKVLWCYHGNKRGTGFNSISMLHQTKYIIDQNPLNVSYIHQWRFSHAASMTEIISSFIKS